ncbi:sigma 54-interacting transcriptional regulator [Bacillus piscicola]|uniref:sigma 54-interacting transcriptional regulator n=1 Tax=Bacillus piscicola TaxID=1632684 RepID=UPI001F08A8BD|nr:sigma 54-interacting transcriptional regulator [Bacillus piscicola]
MITWKDIIMPIPAVIPANTSIRKAFARMKEQETDLALVQEKDTFVGYCTLRSLLGQVEHVSCLDIPIKYQTDMITVPESAPAAFTHNISLVVTEDRENNASGYITLHEAKNRLNGIRLTELNELFQGSEVGIIKTNINHEIEFMNEEAENILGIPSQFLMRRNYKTLLTMDRDMDQVIQGETMVSVSSSFNYKEISGNLYPLRIDGKIKGIVHIFFSRETFEQAVQELDFVRNIYSDMLALYASSQEQILVVDHAGNILRAAGTFLKDFWGVEEPKRIIGENIQRYTDKKGMKPNIFDLCVSQRKKVTAIQEADNIGKIWSVATPIYHEEKLERVVILLRSLKEGKSGRLEKEQDISGQVAAANSVGKEIVYRSQLVESLLAEMHRVAQMNSTVLLEGESGVGKEIFAHKIHASSPRYENAYIRINCGAIPEQLIESELFGYEHGAFTGADRKGKAGYFELAHNGTLFLDEVGELPLNMQVKLLRVLQEKEITRIGGTQTISINVRIIAATNKDLRQMVERGEFREDLYYRLNVIPFQIPPLRKRREDIFPLALYFLEQFNHMYTFHKKFTSEAIELLEAYDWPGNVRELQNIVERLLVLSSEEWVDQEVVVRALYGGEKKTEKPFSLGIMPMKDAVDKVENELIRQAMRKYGTATKVSEVLQVSPATISRRMKKWKEGGEDDV